MSRTLLKLLGAMLATVVFSVGCTLALGPALAPLGDTATTVEEPLFLNPLNERSLMFDHAGGLMTALYADENRSPVALEAIPDHVQQAIIDVEDADFYDHDGVNFRATVRALFENVSAGGIEQGGSTITQQVVKNSIIGDEQSLERKAQEAVIALRLEEVLTKDQILERYLNTAYFGNGAYGVQAAAETYWGVGVESLDWGQAALLAALIRNPNGYNPIASPDIATARRDLALDRIVAEGDLTEAEALPYRTQPLPTQAIRTTPPPDTYFIERVKLDLLRDPRFGLGDTAEERNERVFYGGLRVFTTYHPGMQAAAEVARDGVLPGDAPGTFPFSGRLTVGGVSQRVDATGTSAVVTVENHSGAVRTLVGGPGFQRDVEEYDIASEPEGRQPGSSFKTFVLAAAFEQGMVPADVINGTGPCRFNEPGREEPYEVRGGSRVGTLTSQTQSSSNCGYVRLGQIVGLDNVVDVVERLHGDTPRPDGSERLNPAFMSMPLGSQEMVPLDMAAAYAAFANDGQYTAPYFVERIEDAAGNVLYQHAPAPEQAVSVQTARLVTQVLEANVSSGTGTRARVEGQATAGKTGTTQNSADAWFVGYTPQYTTAVWMGASSAQIAMDNVGGRSVFGSVYPAEIWGQYMNAVLEAAPPAAFPEPEPTRGGRQLRVPPGIEFGTSASSGGSGRGGGGGGGGASRPADDDEDDDEGGGGQGPTTTVGGGAPAPTTAAPPELPPTSSPPDLPPTTAPPAEE